MEFSGYGGNKGYSRLLLGAAPVLYAWPTLTLDPTIALITQWCGFTMLWWADLKATNAGWSECLSSIWVKSECPTDAYSTLVISSEMVFAV